MDIKNKIKELAQTYYPDAVEIRRHLHQNPELSFEEHNTSAYVKQQLQKLDIPFKDGYAGTGIVATLAGKSTNGRTIALRADMDALPIDEDPGNPFASTNKGVMHACGHDAHTSSLLTTAKILKELKDEWEGTILLIFQPGEEKFPGGAKLLLEEGALNNPKPELILGQHVLPTMETGHVGFKAGKYMASGDEVYLTVKGQGGHGGMPHTLNDTVLIAAQIIVSLQQIVSRIVPADIPTVLSFGKFIANGATNIIPEKVEIAGTLRTMNEEWRAKIKNKIKEIAEGTANSFGVKCEVKINDGYPAVYNNEEVTRSAQNLAYEYLGKEQVEDMDIRMTAEDLGYYN